MTGKHTSCIENIERQDDMFFGRATYISNIYLCVMSSPITISPNIQSGEPVFSNTRVPVKNLFDYLKAGHSLNEFLDDFPSVTKTQAVEVIEHFENLLHFQSVTA